MRRLLRRDEELRELRRQSEGVADLREAMHAIVGAGERGGRVGEGAPDYEAEERLVSIHCFSRFFAESIESMESMLSCWGEREESKE